MTCNVNPSALDGFIDNQLSAAERLELNAHVMQCDDCKTQLEWLAQSKTYISELTPPPMSADFDARLKQRMAEVDQANSKIIPWPKRFRYPVQAVAASVALAVALLTQMLWKHSPMDDDYLALDGSNAYIEVGVPQANAASLQLTGKASEQNVLWSDEDVDSFDRFTQVDDDFQQASCGTSFGEKGCDLGPELQVASLTISSSI